MEIRNTALDQAVTGTTATWSATATTQPTVAASPMPGTDSTPGANGAPGLNWSSPLFPKIYGDKTAVNTVADMVKQANDTLGAAGEIIGKMKQQLDGIVKNYPPFPPGDTQRMKYLEGFMSLRKQIEQLTFPPDNSRLTVTIPALPIDPARDTSDAPIYEALGALGSAAGMIAAQQRSLNTDYRTALAQTAPAQSPVMATSLPDYGIAQKSRSIAQVLTTTAAGLSSPDNYSLLKAL